jgi:hypothetical protein
MSHGALLIGLLWAVAFVAPCALAAHRVVRRVLVGQPTDVRLLASTVVGLALLTVPAEVVGVFGQLRRLPLLVAYLSVCAVCLALTRGGERPSRQPDARRWQRPGIPELCTAGLLALVVVAWLVQTREAFSEGTLGFDSLAYHLPFAAAMVTTGHTDLVPSVLWYLPNNSFPATGSLVHALGMVAAGRDVLSPFVSLLWLAQALLAAAVAFRSRPARLLSLSTVCVVVLIPGYFTPEAGTALVDLGCAAFVLTGLALLRRLDRTPAVLALVGLSMGLAVGIKLTAAIPAALLLVGLVVWPGARRWAGAGWYLGAAVIGGGFWFVRNAVRLGNPLPALDLPFLPATPHLHELPRYDAPQAGSVFEPLSIAHYLVEGRDLSVIGDGIALGFGPLWFVVLAGALVGALLAATRLSGVDRGIAAIALLGAVGYLVTPESAPSVDGHPLLHLITIETKVLLPVMMAAALALAAVVSRAGHRTQAAVSVALVLTAVVQVADPGIYAFGALTAWESTRLAVVLMALLAALGAAALVRSWSVRELTLLTAGAAGIGLALVAAGLDGWSEDRYRGKDLTRLPEVQAALGERGSQRLVVAAPGNDVATYPLWGSQLEHRVHVFGHRGPHGEFRAPVSCRELLTELAGVDADVVVLANVSNPTTPPLQRWLLADPAARLVVAQGPSSVVVVTGRLSADSCP